MRICLYAAFDKETNERVYTHCNPHKVQAFIDAQEHPEKFEMRHKFASI